MVFDLNEELSVQDYDSDDSTIYTAAKPSKTHFTNLWQKMDNVKIDEPKPLLVPWPGSTFIIRCISSGHVLTLVEGQLTLAPQGGLGSIHWACVETEGWLGFRNIVSGKFLGRDVEGSLSCFSKQHRAWEFFCTRTRPEGGCVLLMIHEEGLRCVRMRTDQGVEKLAKIGDGGSAGIGRDFVVV